MKILHLSDLHLGKKVNDISMINEQRYVLKQAIALIKDEDINYVLISGDVFDRVIASFEALELFSDFLGEMVSLCVKIFIISGNHDSAERLSYLNSILKKSMIFISDAYNGQLERVSTDNFDIYLMPFLQPAIIRKYFPNNKISDYNDAIKIVLDNLNLNPDKINIILAHQFVSAGYELIQSESEQKSVGGIDIVDYRNFEKFDYTALGHLHCPQKVGLEKIRYGGSILKYSFSEINQNKVFTILEFNDNKELSFKFIKIKFLHEMKEYRGYLDDFLNKDFYSKINTDDYIHFTLLDENVIDAKKKLSMIYPNIMILEFDNSFTRNLNSNFIDMKSKNKSIFEHFCDFYDIQIGSKLDDNKLEIVQSILNKGDNDVTS